MTEKYQNSVTITYLNTQEAKIISDEPSDEISGRKSNLSRTQM